MQFNFARAAFCLCFGCEGFVRLSFGRGRGGRRVVVRAGEVVDAAAVEEALGEEVARGGAPVLFHQFIHRAELAPDLAARVGDALGLPFAIAPARARFADLLLELVDEPGRWRRS